MEDIQNQDNATSGGDSVNQPVTAETVPPTPPAQPLTPPAQPTAPPVQPSAATPLKMPEILKTAGNQPSVSSEDKIWGLISYIPLMALMALVLRPSSDFIKLHGRQGLLIFLIFFFSIFVYLVPYIGPLIGAIIHFAMIGIGLFSMYQAFIGNWWKIPVLGEISELIPVEMFAKVTREAVMGPKVAEEIEQKSAEEQLMTGGVQPPAGEKAAGEVQQQLPMAESDTNKEVSPQ